MARRKPMRIQFDDEEEVPPKRFEAPATTSKNHVYIGSKRGKIAIDSDQTPFPTDMVETSEQYNRELKAYKKVAQAVKIMEDTIEADHLIDHNESFKRKYVNLLLAIKWYKSHRRHFFPGTPLPTVYLPHEHQVLKNPPCGYVNPNKAEKKVRRRRELSIFPYPCLVEDVPFTESYLNIHRKYNMMSLSAFNDLGVGAIKKLRHAGPPPPRDRWINHLPIGTAVGLQVSCVGHLIPIDFLIIDTGLRAKKRVIFGKHFTKTTDSVIDTTSGFVDFSLNGSNKKYRIWRNVTTLKDGTPFRVALAHFFDDLIWMANEQAKLLGGLKENLSKEEIDKLYKALTRGKEPIEEIIITNENSMRMIEERKGASTSRSGNLLHRTQRKRVIYPRNNPDDFYDD